MPKPSAPLDVERVRGALTGRLRDVRYVAETGSTNADARLLLGDPAAFGATLVAEYQSAGAGRKGRSWIAPPGAALLFTTILPHGLESRTLWAMPFWIALGVASAVAQCSGVQLDLVWPNDLHARGAKAGGILSVARIAGDTAWVGCGVGLNVIRPADDAQIAALTPQPIFLDELAAGIEREALLAAILRTFDATFDELREPHVIARAWETRAQLAGTPYRYRRDSDGIERAGIAQRIGPHGTLIVRDHAGDVAIDMADVRVIGHADYQRSNKPASTSPPPKP